MKAKKRDGGERDVPPHQTNKKPKEPLKLIHEAVALSLQIFKPIDK